MNKNEIERVIIAVINGKGGVGKTLTTSIIADWLDCQLISYSLLDCDDNQSLSKLLPFAGRHNIKPADGIEMLIGKILENEITLTDTPANISTEVHLLFSSVDFAPSLESVYGRLVIMVPIVANDAASWDEARRTVMAIKTTASYIIVKNQFRGSDFSSFDNSSTGQFLKAAGAKEITIPKIDDSLQRLMNTDRLTLAQFIGRYWHLHSTEPVSAFRQTVQAQQATNHLNMLLTQLNLLAQTLLPATVVPRIETMSTAIIKDYCCRAWKRKNQKNN